MTVNPNVNPNVNPIIIALDVENAGMALRLVDQLGPESNFYKVGMELYAAEGMPVIRELVKRNKRVFLDLKLYDIGETVKRAVAQIARTEVTFLTVHGSGAVMRSAVEGRGGSSLKLLGVTVLTSFDQQDLTDLGFPCELSDLMALRVRNAMTAGMDGVICSPLEVRAVREVAGPEAILATPGVRSAGASTGDQKRTATPRQAMEAGANYLVVGREVTRAADPAAEFKRILSDSMLELPQFRATQT